MSLAALVTSVLISGILISGFLIVGMVCSFGSGMAAGLLADRIVRVLVGTPSTASDGYKCIHDDKHLQAPGAPGTVSAGDQGSHLQAGSGPIASDP